MQKNDEDDFKFKDHLNVFKKKSKEFKQLLESMSSDICQSFYKNIKIAKHLNNSETLLLCCTVLAQMIDEIGENTKDSDGNCLGFDRVIKLIHEMYEIKEQQK